MRHYSTNEKKHFKIGQNVWLSREAMCVDDLGRIKITRASVDEIYMRVTSIDAHVPIFLSSDCIRCTVIRIPETRNSVLISIECANVPIYPYLLMNRPQWNNERGVRLSNSLGI